MRQRPLPVDLEKFRSPKTLLLATTRCRLHHLLSLRLQLDRLATFHEPHTKSAQLPRRQGSRHRARMRQRPLPVLLEKFRSPKTLLLATTRCRLHHLICPSTATRSSRNLHTSLAPTSPDGRAPVTGARIPQRPLPVDLEKFRSPKPLHFLFSSSSLATSLHPSTATRSSSLRDSHELCTNSPRRLGFRTPRPHATAPSSGGPRKISKSKTTRSHHFLLCSSQVSPQRPIHSEPLTTSLHPLGSTSPDGRAPVTRARTRRRPLPVLLEKFQSPKPLVLASSCSSLALRHQLDLHTSLAPTSPDGRAPVTGARSPQRPLPVDLVPDLSTSASNSIFFFSSSPSNSSVSRSPRREPLPQKERGRRRSQRVLRTRDESQ
ncbi:hypothetical protein TNCT_20911 [Trichonephila clavata]|uniref:Uncharacterized protein n=1 Tax=Trichonephila clavata TaxID=2740835 RepID=A0A8X6EYP8_TRICU|nr:hypothetical protein TNCT_20911 [Trichonephila clavata]